VEKLYQSLGAMKRVIGFRLKVMIHPPHGFLQIC
jgi:hypothetical protein